LEKTWAKIYTSFKAAESGFWANAAAAITRAPTLTIRHRTSQQPAGEKDALWAAITEAVTRGWPMGAGTDSAHYGLAAGHAYALLDARIDQTYGYQVVKLRNPWHSDYYRGAIPNKDTNDGAFTMKFDEFYEAFSSTSIAKVYKGYHVTSSELTKKNGLRASYKFATTKSAPFFVSVVWPGSRIVAPCDMLNPMYTVSVQKLGSSVVFTPAAAPAYGVNAVVVEVDPSLGGGAGTYRVAVSITFPKGGYIRAAYMNIYAAEEISIYKASTDFPHLEFGMVSANVGGNPCTTVTIAGHGLWNADFTKTVGGVPTYWSYDTANFGYYVSADDKWYLISKNYFTEVQAGTLWSYAKVPKSSITCGCTDSASGVRGFAGIGCDKVGMPNFRYGNVRCDVSVEYTKLVQKSCPTTCKVTQCSQPPPLSLPTNPAPAPSQNAPAGPAAPPSLVGSVSPTAR